jgi:LysM repeat protein
MICSRWLRFCAAGLWLGAALAGCAPDGNNGKDEQKEAHFLSGRRLAAQMDYTGAMDEYEKALQVNPRSASAHFELALLDEGQARDLASAVYHYQRFLKICPPTDSRADQARDHLNQCMMELARNVSALVILPPSAQAGLEKLAQENRDLKARIAQLEAANAARPVGAVTNPPPPLMAPTNLVTTVVEAAPPANPHPNPNPPPPPPSARTYIIKPRDTLAAIARKYGTTIGALQSANPRVEALHLQPGSPLNLPAP